jgi:oligoribonuclease NrnB/cAMP/cGMP phosphodiesterase (DHH superfamily)
MSAVGTDVEIELARSILSPRAVDCVVYHKGCADGLTAAWALWRIAPTARFLAATYDDDVDALLEATRGRHVIVVDLSFSRAVHLRVRAVAAALLVLDHHASAYRDVGAERDAVFDMTRSGATLAWAYANDAPAPPLVACVQDRDLWQWRLPHSEQFSAAYELLLSGAHENDASFLTTMHSIDALYCSSSLKGFIAEGAVLLRSNAAHIARVLRDKNAVGRRRLRGFDVVVVNSTVLISELGAALCSAYPTACCAIVCRYDAAKSAHSVSARSSATTHPEIDCSAIAKHFGGGGHRQAAGWKWPHSDIESMFD